MFRFTRALVLTVTKLSLISVLLACNAVAQDDAKALPLKPAEPELKPLKAPALPLKKSQEFLKTPDQNADQHHPFSTIERRGNGGFMRLEKPGFMPLRPSQNPPPDAQP